MQPERMDTIKMIKLMKQEDIETYLMVFKRTMTPMRCRKPDGLFMLSLQLTGKAKKTYVCSTGRR